MVVKHDVRGFSTRSEQDRLKQNCSPHWLPARVERHFARAISEERNAVSCPVTTSQEAVDPLDEIS